MQGISQPVAVDRHKDAWLLLIYTKEEMEHSWREMDSILLLKGSAYVGISIVVSCRMQEWVALLREMALSFPTIPALNEYQALVNTDPEVDFFNNVVHLQVIPS